ALERPSAVPPPPANRSIAFNPFLAPSDRNRIVGGTPPSLRLCCLSLMRRTSSISNWRTPLELRVARIMPPLSQRRNVSMDTSRIFAASEIGTICMIHLYQITNTYAKVIFERSENIGWQAFPQFPTEIISGCNISRGTFVPQNDYIPNLRRYLDVPYAVQCHRTHLRFAVASIFHSLRNCGFNFPKQYQKGSAAYRRCIRSYATRNLFFAYEHPRGKYCQATTANVVH